MEEMRKCDSTYSYVGSFATVNGLNKLLVWFVSVRKFNYLLAQIQFT